jgi:hypothetical protein
MNTRQRHLWLTIMILLVPVVAFGDIPDMNNCSISTRATEDVSIMICPGCDGYPFTAAQKFGGEYMDATIDVYIRNGVGQPVANFPYQDLWLDDPFLCFCLGGSDADADTDENGHTQFSFPLCGGGYSENFDLGGYVAGNAFIQNPLPHIKTNSPDINCDLVVNLSDLALFAQHYYGTASYVNDFFWDSVADLRDLALFAQHYNHICHN